MGAIRHIGDSAPFLYGGFDKDFPDTTGITPLSAKNLTLKRPPPVNTHVNNNIMEGFYFLAGGFSPTWLYNDATLDLSLSYLPELTTMN